MPAIKRRNEKVEKRARKLSVLERRMLWSISPDNNAGVGWSSKADEMHRHAVVDCSGCYRINSHL